ncbi:MAG: hypothetical protein M1823_004520 [Watsoniomyces obsoletus]|nr:MAG: hypothetical protein M1823_004520 [Watsoniomyces obsoletus]
MRFVSGLTTSLLCLSMSLGALAVPAPDMDPMSLSFQENSLLKGGKQGQGRGTRQQTTQEEEAPILHQICVSDACKVCVGGTNQKALYKTDKASGLERRNPQARNPNERKPTNLSAAEIAKNSVSENN